MPLFVLTDAKIRPFIVRCKQKTKKMKKQYEKRVKKSRFGGSTLQMQAKNKDYFLFGDVCSSILSKASNMVSDWSFAYMRVVFGLVWPIMR